MATPLTADRLVAALKAEGVKVAEHSGWRTHNRNSVGAWGGVNGVLIHHTAGSNSLGIVYTGRSDLPGPLAHTHLAKNGTATMVGNGRANHAGKAAANAFNALVNESATHPKPSAVSGTVDGNAHLYGIEIENLGTGKDPYPAVQYDAAVRWAAAICRAHGWSANSVAGHKETSIEGKVDPSFDMNKFRTDVAERLTHAANWKAGGTTTTPSTSGDLEMDAKAVHDAVWGRDAIPSPTSASTHTTNPTWKAESYLPEIIDRLAALAAKVDALSKAVEALTKKVA
ncbi:N-acetylmuramoyl-L-alanine amidase [Streptomyces sp. NBC_00356]|uniref:N-acetylmuramoyl-L-alanine amidase n=1 Tax=Streptomyces sp. NBC_00356 TaxID=2975724 RepID=UPI002E25FFD0